MAGLVKLIFTLILLTGVAFYGGDIWHATKDKVAGLINPELQRAKIFDSFKKNLIEIEKVMKEVGQNIDNPDFDKKAKINESLKLLEKSKNVLTKVEESNSTLIEKTIENLRDLKEGAQSFFSENKDSQCEVK
ncbi:MAG: hypothetical protein AAB627_01355 [Patescibacteria group bacterium]